MNRRALQLVALGGLLTVGAQLQAHHAVAGVYDLNKEIVLEGQLTKLNFVNPHASLHLAVPNADGTTTDGERIEVRGCDLWEFRDGLIVRKDSYWKRIDPR